MRYSLFEPFSKMIDELPPKAVFTAVEKERQMLEDDLAFERPLPVKEAVSILNFCWFIGMSAMGESVSVVQGSLPPNHVAFYERTIAKLVKAGQLPSTTKTEFDTAFRSKFQEQLAA